MVSKVSKGGLALAEQIVLTYSDHPSIKAVMVGGSVSRGYADRYSDLEVGVFWADAPTEAERKSAVESVGGKLLTFDEAPRNELYTLDEAAIRGKSYRGTAMISTQHLTVAEMEKEFTGCARIATTRRLIIWRWLQRSRMAYRCMAPTCCTCVAGKICSVSGGIGDKDYSGKPMVRTLVLCRIVRGTRRCPCAQPAFPMD